MSLWIAFFVAAGMAVFLIKSRWNYLRLPELPAAVTSRDVTVIIPARNEERTIARVVSSFNGLRVIVVDDASEDATALQARQAGAQVVNAPALRTGHLGKPNACQAGAAIARSKWLLFVDADTWYAPGFAASLAGYAEHEALDIATAFLHQEAAGMAEKVILPYAFALYFCGVSAANVNSAGSREALANGQCLLVRRAAYEAMGGHAAVASSVIEDVAFAAEAKRRGLRVRVVRAEHSGFVRMYEDWTAIRRGFEKNSFRFLGANPVTGIQVILASILLTSYLPVIAWLVLEAHWAAAVAFALIPSLLLVPWYGGFTRSLAAPAAIYTFQLIALSAMVRTLTGLGTQWKGRHV